MKYIKKYKDMAITILQKGISGLEFVVGLVGYINKALKYLRTALDFLKSEEKKDEA